MAFKVGRCLLQKVLDRRKMTQQELALKMNVDRRQVSLWATGNRVMSLESARTVSHILGCSMEELYDWVEVKS